MSLLMRLVQSRKSPCLVKDLFLFICGLSHDLRELIHLWSHVDRNFSRISICSMGMWQPGISWSSVISLLSSADWAWLMKSTPEGPSRLLASYPSSGSPQNGFCWDRLASKETCMVCSCPVDFFLSWPRCPPAREHDWVYCQLCLHMKSLLRSRTLKQKCVLCGRAHIWHLPAILCSTFWSIPSVLD